MCRRASVVLNRYSGHPYLQKCGVCPACLQERAQRLSKKIADENKNLPSYVTPYFVTLTYKNGTCPYVYKSELISYKKQERQYYKSLKNEKVTRLNYYKSHTYLFRIKRDFNLVRRRSSSGRYFSRLIRGCQEIASKEVYYKPTGFDVLKPLKYSTNKIGVIYYDDYKNFVKRLRQYLNRYYDYDTSKNYFKIFNVGEYGPTTLRPHFHSLVYLDKRFIGQEQFVRCVLKAWPFADYRRTAKFIEPARDVASYVAEYVNCTSVVPKVLRAHFRMQRSCSVFFGAPLLRDKKALFDRLANKNFDVSIVSEFDGKPYNCLLPLRYISYYFPPIPGHGYTAPYVQRSKCFSLWHGYGKREIVQAVRRSYRRCSEQLEAPSLKFEEWFRLYDEVRTAYEQHRLKLFYRYHKGDMSYINSGTPYQDTPDQVLYDDYLTEKFNRKMKIRHINDAVNT